MANAKPNNAGAAIAKNDMDSVTLKAMFVNGVTPNVDTDVYLSDVVSDRASGTTDITLTSFTISVDDTNNFTKFDVADIVTGTITATTNAIWVYIHTGVEATSELLCYLELVNGSAVPTTFTVVSGVLTATVDANGLFTI